jgi:hypothetical protein
MHTKKPLLPNPHQLRQLSVAAFVHPRTVSRCYRGERVRSTVAVRVLEAARSLGFPEPPSITHGSFPWKQDRKLETQPTEATALSLFHDGIEKCPACGAAIEWKPSPDGRSVDVLHPYDPKVGPPCAPFKAFCDRLVARRQSLISWEQVVERGL